MTQEPIVTPELAVAHAPNSAVHSTLRFLALVRRRKSIVLVALFASFMLGLLYFFTTTRVFRARAQIVVRHSRPNSESVTLTADRATQDQMATFQRLTTSAVVLNSALNELSEQDELPPEIDTTGTREQALESLRRGLSTTTLRNTSIIDIAFDSEDREAAARVVDEVVKAYILYIDQNHQSVTAKVSAILKKERVDLETRLDAREQYLLSAKKQCADYGIDGESDIVHPLIQNVIDVNGQLADTRQHRIELESSLSALRDALRRGGDLRQHLLALEPLVAKDLLLDAVGVNPQDAATVSQAEKDLSNYQAKLRTLSVHYGPQHPQIKGLQDQINANQAFIAGVQQRVQQRISGMQDRRLGTMLTSLLEEDLARTWRHERELSEQFRVADSKAMQLSDQLANVAVLDRQVQQLRELHQGLISRIENIDINQHNGDVQVSLITAPVIPEDPFRPVLLRVLLICFVFGSAGGAVAVYVLDAIDDRFRSPEEIQEQLATPVLAMVRRHEMLEGSGVDALQVYQSPDAVESEAFRTLRTTLAFSGQECDRVVVTSSEPSDGKTTVLANLGVSYAQAGRRTLLIDCDLRRPGLTRLFNSKGQEGVSEILRHTEDVAQLAAARIVGSGQEGLDVLPAGRRPADSAELLGRDRFADLVGWAESAYDQVLIDSPPILAAADAAIAARSADGVIVVIQPQKNHRRLVLRSFEGLHSLGANVLGTVVNAVSEEDGTDYYGYGGYGYGYGYGYGEGYGEDDADQTESDDQSIVQMPAVETNRDRGKRRAA